MMLKFRGERYYIRLIGLEKSEYIFRIEIEKTEALKKRYPKAKEAIESQDDVFVFDMERMHEKSLGKANCNIFVLP